MHILIAVLDWGLGHASRSIALAEQLRAEGHRISWASAGPALAMIREHCYFEVSHELPAYAIHYSGRNMHWNVATQLPKIWRTVRAEQREIERIVSDFKVAKLISDSRFGCYSQQCPSVFLTHQLHPIFGLPLAGTIYRSWLRHFDEYWVPDNAGPDRLSGKLSDPAGYANVKYIGPLSRLAAHRDPRIRREWTNVALLSGPEPQRSHLETRLLNQWKNAPGRHLIIRGKPEADAEKMMGNCRILPYTTAPETAHYLQAAQRITCRSGYSTLMDLGVLGLLDERVTLIPTPGQTEQEYLARRLAK